MDRDSKLNEIELKKFERNRRLNHISENNLLGRDYILIVLSLLIMTFSVIFVTYNATEIFAWYAIDSKSEWGNTISTFFIILSALHICFLVYLIVLYIKYKETPTASDEDLPTCTVIVPAYNEGKLVYETLLSLAGSDYPMDKLEILAIDDGSKDDTWLWIQKAKEILGERLQIFKQPQNLGKRHALYKGFTEGKGEIFVTVDSDSIVDDNTLRNLVSPFHFDKKCGAVAGNVRVLNKPDGVIPKMLNISFTFSFEFVRSAQSTVGSVFCTPGALAAYRREAVLNCLDEWMNQLFMGKPSTIGEDRAITNMILKQGYNVLYQKNANVYTNVPEQYENLYKMYLRWERSNIRENIMMSKFAFSNFNKENVTALRIMLLMQWLNVVLAIPLFICILYFFVTNPLYFIASSLTGILIFSSVQVLFYTRKYSFLEGLLAYCYSIFYLFSLCWITPYSILTASNGGWLTREVK